jgi:hypothetical protein
MPLKIVVPASVILQQKDGVLKLDQPLSCSRCGQSPADFFESHRLKLRAGLKHNPLPGRRYKLDHNYTLKLRLCPRCYQMSYLEAPETLTGDANSLGRLSRLQNLLRTLGGVIAALGLILMTPFIPATTAFSGIKAHWWIPIAAGVGLVLLGLYSQVIAQMKLRRALESAGEFDISLSRAKVRTPLYANPADQSQVALEINVDNEKWVQGCAAYYHFHIEEFAE